MPDRDVKTIRDLVYFQYAKIIAKSAFGPDAKKTAYGFIKKTFFDFQKNEKRWSDILREDKQFIQSEKKCIYCGSEEEFTWDHIVPKSLMIKSACASCDKIQGIHNLIWTAHRATRKKAPKASTSSSATNIPRTPNSSTISRPCSKRNTSRPSTPATSATPSTRPISIRTTKSTSSIWISRSPFASEA